MILIHQGMEMDAHVIDFLNEHAIVLCQFFVVRARNSNNSELSSSVFCSRALCAK
jgi:hypothetical protein